jgi:hypothetical protein
MLSVHLFFCIFVGVYNFSPNSYECITTQGTPYVVNDLQSAYKDALLGRTIFASSSLPTFEE